MELWNRVKGTIKRENTTQDWVAERSGISLSTFKGWIAINRLPSVTEDYRIAQTLNTCVEYLVDGEAGEKYII